MNHTIRCKSGGTAVVKNYTRSRAIKLFCSECLGWGETHPKECAASQCPLFPYRGKATTTTRKRTKTATV